MVQPGAVRAGLVTIYPVESLDYLLLLLGAQQRKCLVDDPRQTLRDLLPLLGPPELLWAGRWWRRPQSLQAQYPATHAHGGTPSRWPEASISISVSRRICSGIRPQRG